MPESQTEPLLSSHDDAAQERHDGHFVCNIEGPVVRGFNSTIKKQLREIYSLLIYYSQFASLLAIVVLLFQAGSWQWATAALVVTATHHVVLSVVLMVRNGWVQTAWNYCCGVFMFNPMEGFDFLEEGCVGIIVAGACWLMYLALALMGLGFLSYCLLCYLATALVFSLLLMDLSLLAATLLQASPTPLLAPSELLYIENFRASRLTLLAALQSLPLLLLTPPALAAAYLLPTPPLPLPTGTPPWLIPLVLTLALLSLLDASSLLRQATRASGTTLPLYLSYILQLRGAVKVPPALMPAVVRDMIRADGCLRVSNAELDMERWPEVACQLVPAYLLPLDADRLEPCQLVAALREACSAVMDAMGCSRPDSCGRIPMPRLVLEADLGQQHSAEALLLGLRALDGLESVSVLGGRLGGPRFWEVGRQMAAHFFLSELRLADVRLDATALHVLSQLLSGPHCAPLARLEILRSTLPKGRPPGSPPRKPRPPSAGMGGGSSGGGRGMGAMGARAAGGAAGGEVEGAEVEEAWEEGVQASFFAALSSNSTLRYLSMSGTPLEASGVAALCKVLQASTALAHLDLSFCTLHLEGAQALAAALAAAPPTLQHLAIAPSDATPLGTAALIRTTQARLQPPPHRSPPPHPPSTPPLPPPKADAEASEPQLRARCLQLYTNCYRAGLLLAEAPAPGSREAAGAINDALHLQRGPDGRIHRMGFDLRSLLAPTPSEGRAAAGALPTEARARSEPTSPTAAAAARISDRIQADFRTLAQRRQGAGGGPLGGHHMDSDDSHAGSPLLDPLGQQPPSPTPGSPLEPLPSPFDHLAASDRTPRTPTEFLADMQSRQGGTMRPPQQPPMLRAQPPNPLGPLHAPHPASNPSSPRAPAPHPFFTSRRGRPVPTTTLTPTPFPPAPIDPSTSFHMAAPGLWYWTPPSSDHAAPPTPPQPRPTTPPPTIRPRICLRCSGASLQRIPVTNLPGVTFHCLQNFTKLTSGDWLQHQGQGDAPPGGLTLSLLCYEDHLSTLVQAPLLLPGLSVLDFSRVDLTETHLRLLGQSLQACPTLTQLTLNGANIDDGRMQLLAAALPAARSLSSLALSSNAVSMLGGLALCQAVEALPNLRYLQLLHNLHPLPGAVLNRLSDIAAARPSVKVDVIFNGQWGALPADPTTAPEPLAGPPVTRPPGPAAAEAGRPAAAEPADGGEATGGASADGPGAAGEEPLEGGAGLTPGGAAAGSSGDSPKSSSSSSASSGSSECGICCDSSDTIAIQMCQHHICASCYRNIHQMSGPRHPFTCPYCRAPIQGYRYLRLPALLQGRPREPPHPHP